MKLSLREFAIQRAGNYRDLLMGPGGRIRSAIGFSQATRMVAAAAENLDVLTDGIDPVATSIAVFSKRRGGDQNIKRFSEDFTPSYEEVPPTTTGISSVSNLQTISAIDITLQMLIYSFLPWIAIERPMNDSTTTISWREIVATNSAGGVSKGDRLIGNFIPENAALNLNTPVKTLSANGAGAPVVINFQNQIYDGTILVTLVNTNPNPDLTYSGKDYNGVVLFPGITQSFVVDYEAGTLTSQENVLAGWTVTAAAMTDMFASKTAPNVLRTTTKMKSVQMVSRESGIVIEDSVDRMMFILKTLKQAGGAVTLEQYMQQMLFDLYVSFVNNLLMIGIHTRSAQLDGTPLLTELTQDLSAYGGQIIAEPNRKYDELSTLINLMDSKMLATANLGITALIVGTRIANIMASDTFRFKKSNTFNSQMNTLIGVYDGKPVLRHQYIDRFIDTTDLFGNIFGVHRDPAGEVAFMAYGEFLPIHTTDNVYNYANPLEFARALVSQIGTQIIEPTLCMRARFRLTAPN